MRPFPGRSLPPDQQIFNHRLSGARLVVENAFGILSSQWRMYRCVVEVRPEVAEKCVKATCVLNFLRKTQPVAMRGSVLGGATKPLFFPTCYYVCLW